MKTAISPRTVHLLCAAVLSVGLVACGDKPGDTPSPANSAADAVQQVQSEVEPVAQLAQQASDAAAPDTSNGEPTLGVNQTLEGVIELDLGQGPARLYSIANTLATDLVEKSGNPELADLAGKIVHGSSIRRSSDLNVELEATGSGVGNIEIALVLDPDTLALKRGNNIIFIPSGNSMADDYRCSDHDCPDLVFELERAERNADGTVALAGTFSAQELRPDETNKRLVGTALGPVQGRFDFEALVIR